MQEPYSVWRPAQPGVGGRGDPAPGLGPPQNTVGSVGQAVFVYSPELLWNPYAHYGGSASPLGGTEDVR